MSSSPLERLERYATAHPKEFPKLKSALRTFRGFVGNKEVKNSVARLVMYYISYARVEKTLRRSKRKRNNPQKEKPLRRSRRRAESTDTEEVEISEEAGAALIAAFLQAVADHGDSSDEDWVDEEEEESTRPDWMVGPLMHVMLVGQPGTGKTTFAQMLVDLWDAIGLVDGTRYTKTTRADWVGKYQGHSTQKAKRLIESNDVIFIDEAYSLINGRSGDDMYGHEILNEIVAAMTDEEQHTLFIFAGYKGDMEKLYNANRGLERRFGYIFELQKPSAAELFLIFQKQLKKMKWRIPTKERNKALEWFGSNAAHFKFGGGSTQQFIFHAQQNAIERTFPNAAERLLTIRDLQVALESSIRVKRNKDTCKPISKRGKKRRRTKETTSKRRASIPSTIVRKGICKKTKSTLERAKRIARQTTATIQDMYI
jgi:SpoVK/Ycf46/Vps4 family AAA+-type ATPase